MRLDPPAKKPTPDEWLGLSYREQQSVWPTLSAAEQAAMKAKEQEFSRSLEQRRGGSTAALAASRPGSEVCCYIFAWLSLLGGVGALFGELGAGTAAAIFVGAVFWWALGDIVGYLARIAQK